MPGSHWANYEEVAQCILNEMASHFGLGRVEGKQVVPGTNSGYWGCRRDHGISSRPLRVVAREGTQFWVPVSLHI